MRLLRPPASRLAAIMVLITVAVVSGVVTMWLTAEEDKIRLPKVLGMDSTTALSLLRDQGLQPKVSGREYSEEIQKGAVLFQRPASGTWVQKNGTVRLVVSLGSGTVALPDLTGLPLPQVRQLLQQHDLTIGRMGRVHSLEYPMGEVIAQDPEAGTRVRRGSQVAVLLSLGPREEPVPVLTLPSLSLLGSFRIEDRPRAVVGTEVIAEPWREVPEDSRTRWGWSNQWRPRDLDGFSFVNGHQGELTTLVASISTRNPIAQLLVRTMKRPGAVRGSANVLVGAGDIASCVSDGDEATASLLDTIKGVVFTLGDNVYPHGTPIEFMACYDQSWGRHKSRTHPTPGNHDYHTRGAFGYFDYFGDTAGDPVKGYYSYNLGSWHIIVLNSNCATVGGCGPGSPQEQWLRTDLAAHPTTCTLAYWHHPRFSSGSHGGDAALEPFWKALYDYNAEVVLAGHDHVYERFAPQTPNGEPDPARGLRQFVVGTGGESHHVFTGPAIANSEVRNDETFGVLKLTLHRTSYKWQFIPVAGRDFTDSGSGRCH